MYVQNYIEGIARQYERDSLFGSIASSGGALVQIGTWSLEIIKRSDTVKGFELLPRRWVVERTIAWLNRNRRLAKDFEATIESAVAWIMVASIKLLSRRMARA